MWVVRDRDNKLRLSNEKPIRKIEHYSGWGYNYNWMYIQSEILSNLNYEDEPIEVELKKVIPMEEALLKLYDTSDFV